MKKWIAGLLCCLMMFSLAALAAEEKAPRDLLIDRIIENAKVLYDRAHGRAQRAKYAGDIYVCKNFTTYLFRENIRGFAMEAYPNVKLIIPNNLPVKQSRPYAYGIAWEKIAAEKGNPFETAAEFYYDKKQTRQENRERALALMKEVRRGDFFQMSAKYAYGTGAHSLIFIADYDAETNTVRWTDSNMKGTTRNGIRYGYVQYDAVKEIEWFVDAFCRPGKGATLYRLREDIIQK